MTKFDSHKWIREHREGKFNEASLDRTGQPIQGFKPGDTWRDNFDYVGMLKYGANLEIPVDVQDSGALDLEFLETLNLLFESFQDVNYHREGGDLGNAIEWFEDSKGIEDIEKAVEFLELFKASCQKTLTDITKGK